MVAIPVGYDQPGVAARIAHHGVGEFVDIEDLEADRLRGLIQEVLGNPRYGEKARWFQEGDRTESRAGRSRGRNRAGVPWNGIHADICRGILNMIKT